MLPFEIANGLTKMIKMKVFKSKDEMIKIFDQLKLIHIKMVEIDIEKALEIAWEYKLYAYDAFYLEAAKRLHLPLVTFDDTIYRVGNLIGLTMLGGKNASN